MDQLVTMHIFSLNKFQELDGLNLKKLLLVLP